MEAGMTPVAIGVVVVNWNGWRDTIACLESLARATPRPECAVVVDNGSTDDSVEVLQRWATTRDSLRVSIVAAGANRGFSAGNNLGIAQLARDARISHFLLLNNDATVEPTFFAELARALEHHPDAGLVGATIYEANEARPIWYAGGGFVPLRCIAVHHHAVPTDQVAVPTDFVTGCAMLVARATWEVLGPLPECYFIYMEDAEYSWRARAAGLPVMYAPRAVVLHAVSTTVMRAVTRARRKYLMTRNRALFVRRNLRGWTRWAAIAYLVITKPGRALLEALAGRPRDGWAFLRGAVSGLLAKDGTLRATHRARAS
ncbi:MAG: hypothetical protein DMD49_13510 [Gemmatimonadetes bacterium]|nr:MAG: hypothetical protein DMD49_13510 [Gemmatimonadota bacterium]